MAINQNRRTSRIPHILERPRGVEDRTEHRRTSGHPNPRDRHTHTDAQADFGDGAHACEGLHEERKRRAVYDPARVVSVFDEDCDVPGREGRETTQETARTQ